MLPARGPFCEGSSSKLTRCPPFSCSNSPASTALRWKNHSCPPSSRMKPKPRSRTRRLIVPFATSCDLRQELRIKFRSVRRTSAASQRAPSTVRTLAVARAHVRSGRLQKWDPPSSPATPARDLGSRGRSPTRVRVNQKPRPSRWDAQPEGPVAAEQAHDRDADEAEPPHPARL